MGKHRIYSVRQNALNENDRQALAALLIKAGYTVRIGREQKGKSNSYIYFVEYWEEHNE